MENDIQLLSELTKVMAETDKKVDALDNRVVKLFSYIYSDYNDKINAFTYQVSGIDDNVKTNTNNIQALQTQINTVINTQAELKKTLENVTSRLLKVETNEKTLEDKVNQLTYVTNNCINTTNNLNSEFANTYNYVKTLIPANEEQVVLLKPVTGIYKLADKLTRLFSRKKIQEELDHKKRLDEINNELNKLEEERKKFKNQQEEVLNVIENERKEVDDLKHVKEKSKKAQDAISTILGNIW